MSAYSKITQQLAKCYDHATNPATFSPANVEIGSGNMVLPITASAYTVGTRTLEISADTENVVGVLGDLPSPDLLVYEGGTDFVKVVKAAALTFTGGEASYVIPLDVSDETSHFALSWSNAKSGTDLQKNVKKWSSYAISSV